MKTRTKVKLGFTPNKYYRNWSHLKALALIIKTRIRIAKLDAIIAITGYNGHGKSSLAAALSSLIDPGFDYQKQIIWNEDAYDCEKIIEQLDKYTVIWYDEAINQFSSDDWNTGDTKKFNKEYTVNRSENKAHILCIPSFKKLNTFMRNERVFFWIHVYKRRLGRSAKAKVIYRDTISPFTDDPFHLKLYEFWKKYYTNDGKQKLTSKLLIKIISQLPNTWSFDVTFPPMPSRFESRYEELKDERKRINEENRNNPQENERIKRLESENKKLMDRFKTSIFQLSKLGMTQSQMAAVFDVSRGYIGTLKADVVARQGIKEPIINKKDKSVKIKKNSRRAW